MNKIKIINNQALKTLKQSRKDLKIDIKHPPKRLETAQSYLDAIEHFHHSLASKRRPSTPSDVIRTFYQCSDAPKSAPNSQSFSNYGQIQRKSRLKASEIKNAISYERLLRIKGSRKPSAGIPQSYSEYKEKKRKDSKMSEQKQVKQELQAVNKLKQQISSVFKEINAENDLAKIRLDKKMTNYKESKFDKFWKIHKVERFSVKMLNNHKMSAIREQIQAQ